MLGAIVLLACRILLIFIVALFIIVPLAKNLFKLCYKQIKKEQKDIQDFIERENNE